MMAKNSVPSASEDQGLVNSRQRSTIHPLQVCTKMCCHTQTWTVRSKGAVLVIVWLYLLFTSYINPGYSLDPPEAVPEFLQTSFIYLACAVITLGPLAGFAASAYFSRFNAMRTSMWLVWGGNTVIVLVEIMQNLLENHQVLYFVVKVAAVSVNSVGLALFMVNSVPFGVDQMPYASGEQICAFLHWFVWAIFAGVATNMLIFTLVACTEVTSKHSLFLSLLSAAILTLQLSSLFVLRNWLTIEPTTKNPLKAVFKVLRFAVKHTQPVRRSAFTYCENKKPSRLDLAKSKYGGPFTNEEVEDVKTCLRMGVVIVCVGVTIAPFIICGLSVDVWLQTEFTYTYLMYHCKDHMVQLGMFLGLCILLSPPVFRVTLNLFTRCCSCTALRRIGSAQTLFACTSLTVLVLSVVWYVQNSPNTCMFAQNGALPLSVDHRWVEIPIKLLQYCSLFVFLTALLEFICAQAPYRLRGLVVGSLYSVILLSATLAVAIFSVWKSGYGHGGTSHPGCSVWFYLFTTIAATLGCVLWCAVAKWYNRRERDEPEMYRIFAENYYDRYCGRPQ